MGEKKKERGDCIRKGGPKKNLLHGEKKGRFE